MSQGIKIIAGLLAVITLLLIASALVWLTATVNQLTKDKDRLDLTTQKLASSADELADRVKTLERQNVDVGNDIRDVRREIDGLNTVIEEFISATGRQLYDVKKVIVEQDNQISARMDALETANAEYSSRIEELSGRISSAQKTTGSASKPEKKPTGRIFVDVNNPNGPVGWENSYTVQLRSVVADEQNFRIDWTDPEMADDISATKPDIVKKIPKFRDANQLYFILKLGDAADNRIAGVMDFAPTDKEYFTFDLYLDKDRDGNLAEDFVKDLREGSYYIKDVKILYNDGKAEEYAMEIYAVQDGEIRVWYAPQAGRYGVLEANQKRISILVLDKSGNGIFNDSDDVILMDLDFDGRIDLGTPEVENRELYSDIELPGGKYRVTEIDPAGRRLTLGRMR